MKKNFTQDQLVALLKSDSNKAFEYLYDNYSPAFFNIIHKIVRVKEHSPDILQDAFVKIWLRIHTYDPAKGTLFTWMLNIVRNTAVDRLRTEKTLTPNLEIEAVTDSELVRHTSVHPAYIHMDLKAFVEKLPVNQKEVITMIYFEGYTHEELARAMELPTGTVKSRVRKGLQDLRQFYQEPGTALKAA